MLLAGDIGGTKTHLAIYAPGSDPHDPLVEARFSSDEYPSLQALAQDFLSRVNYDVQWGSFGVAGPVINGHVKATNLPWEMDERELEEALGLRRAHLLNDLEAVASAVPSLSIEDRSTLNEGTPQAGGAIAVIAPGTGLGEGFLAWDGSRYHAYPSEGGHTDFAPINDVEIELLRYLMRKYDHVSYEWVCSGMGIPNIYDFYKDNDYAPEPEWLAEQLSGAEDRTPVIVSAALAEDRDCALAEMTLRTFVSVLGAEAGNLALKVLATGGVYLGGGIPPRILPALKTEHFMQAFLRKGRFSALLERMPVHIIVHPRVGVMGAAAHGLEMMQQDGA